LKRASHYFEALSVNFVLMQKEMKKIKRKGKQKCVLFAVPNTTQRMRRLPFI
jgi:hypothetical protein